MASPRQKVANSLNAEHSTGPKSEAGKRAAAVNSLKHGLSIPVDESPMGQNLGQVATLLASSDGLSEFEANEISRSIIDFERNQVFQREVLARKRAGEPVAVEIPDDLKNDHIVGPMLEQTFERGAPYDDGFGDLVDLSIQKMYIRFAEKLAKQSYRNAAQTEKNSDRYFRRSANQMIKRLKGLKGTD